MMRKRNVLVFDFDGVLVNNTPQGYEKINMILKEINLPAVSDEFLRKIWGKHMNDLATAICKQRNANDEQLAYFKKREKEIYVVGAFDKILQKTLRDLPQYGFLTAIITSRSRDDFEKYARKIGLDLGIFHYVQTPEDYPILKPDGGVFKPLLKWCQNLGNYTSGNIVYFGDTVAYDYQAVKNFNQEGYNIKFVGVCSGVDNYEDFLVAGLDEEQIITSHDVLAFYLSRLIHKKFESRKLIS